MSFELILQNETCHGLYDRHDSRANARMPAFYANLLIFSFNVELPPRSIGLAVRLDIKLSLAADRFTRMLLSQSE